MEDLIEELFEKDRARRADRRCTKAKAKSKAKKKAIDLCYADPEFVKRIKPHQVDALLAEHHYFTTSWTVEGKGLDKPRRRYSIYEDYEDRPQCFITIEPEVVYVIKEHWI